MSGQGTGRSTTLPLTQPIRRSSLGGSWPTKSLSQGWGKDNVHCGWAKPSAIWEMSVYFRYHPGQAAMQDALVLCGPPIPLAIRDQVGRGGDPGRGRHRRCWPTCCARCGHPQHDRAGCPRRAPQALSPSVGAKICPGTETLVGAPCRISGAGSYARSRSNSGRRAR